MPIRLKDIAADLGVSIVTVSKVLRNQPDIGEETRRRVLQRVQELNYRPNMMARGLASGRSHTVGLIVPDLIDPFFAEIARSLHAALRAHAYQLLIASADENAQLEQMEIENLLARGVDALFVASCQESASGFEPIARRAVPFILLDRSLPDLETHFVGIDDCRAGALATEHLLSLGRTRIAHIGGEGISTSIERLQGYRDALTAHHIPYRPEWVLLRNLHTSRADRIGRAAMDDLLALPERPDAVFCYNDLLAVGAIRSVLARGLRVPEDIAIIGCGNLSLSSYLEVPLSSIDQGTAELGQIAASLALALVTGKDALPTQTRLVAPRVVARCSTTGVAADD